MAERDFSEPGADVFDADVDAQLDDVIGDVFDGAEAPPPKRSPRKPRKSRAKAKPTPEPEAQADEEDADLEDDADEDDDESAAEPEGDDDTEDSDEDSEDDEDPDEEDVDDIEAIRRERDDLKAREELRKAQDARDKEVAEQRATQAKWNEQWDKGQAHFKGLKAQVYANAPKSPNPTAYIQQNLDRIEADHDRWNADFNRNYQARRTDVSLDLAIRAFAAESRVEYGLTVDETQRLAAYAKKYPDPDLVNDFLENMIQSRDDNKAAGARAAQKARKKVAKEVAQKTPRPGQGRRSPRQPRNVDEYINSLDLPSFA